MATSEKQLRLLPQVKSKVWKLFGFSDGERGKIIDVDNNVNKQVFLHNNI